MTVRRILFRGSATACAKYLPFAKSQLKALSKRYAGRRDWTWETQAEGVKISLEQNGPIQWIRIVAGFFGHEFIGITDDLLDPYGDHGSTFTIATPAVIPNTDPRETELVAKNKNGTRLKPTNADRHIDHKDKWIKAGRHDDLDDEGEYIDQFFWPTTDWFQVRVPETDEEALTMVDGVPRRKMMIFRSWRPRHVDLSLYDPAQGDLIPPFKGIVFYINSGGRPRATFLSTGNSAPSPNVSGHWPRSSGASAQGPLFMAASWRGDDFKFEAREENYEDYTPANSNLFSFTKPAWVFGDVGTQWFWRGDGTRCVSLQYGTSYRPDDPGEQTPENFDTNIDPGFVEAEVIVEPDPEGGPPIITSGSFLNSQHDLLQIGIHPVAIDYVMLDQRKKRAYYFEQYIGPVRLSGTHGYTGNPRYVRDLLVYLVSAIIDDNFPGTEEWRLPVWHGEVWQGSDTGGPTDPDTGDDVLINGIYWGGYETYENLGFVMRDDVSGAEELGDPIHPYVGLRAAIVGMDARTGAVAMTYELKMSEPHDVSGRAYGETESIYYGKYWRIWGEERQNTWITPDLDTAIEVEDPGGAGGAVAYDWADTDPSVWEDAEPPLPDPTEPPVDFFGYLASVPPGYELFIKGSAYDIPRMQTFLQRIMSTILRHTAYLGVGAGQATPFRNFEGFRCSPTKSFSLAVSTRSNFQWVALPTELRETVDYGVPSKWWTYYRIEKNRGVGQEPLTARHDDLYNSSRGTDLDFQVRAGNVSSLAINGLWVE